MAKRNFHVLAKRTLAVVVTMTMLMSCGITGLFTAEAAETGIEASASNPGDAKQLIIYDEYGNVLSNVSDDTPLIYVDNSSRASGGGQPKTEASVYVELRNENEALTDKALVVGANTQNEMYFSMKRQLIASTEHTVKYKLTFMGCYTVSENYTDPLTGESKQRDVERSYIPGRFNIALTTNSGNVSDNITLVVQEPAYDIQVYYGNEKIGLELNDNSMYNTSQGLITTANHSYQFKTSILTEHNNINNKEIYDKVQWGVYDGIITGDNNLTMEQLAKMTQKKSSLAEITDDGLLRTLNAGTVTLVASFKDTPNAQRTYERQMRAYERDPSAFSEIPQYVPDRYPVNAAKKRTIYVPELDENKKIKRDEYGRVIYKTDNKGKKVTKEVNLDIKAVRSNYYLDEDKVLASDPFLDENGDPIYVMNYNTPKFITVHIRKDNPATEIKFIKYPENNTLFVRSGSKDSFQLELEKTPTFNVHEEGYQAGATDEIEWTSSNPEVATVDQNGVVTAVAKGDTVITAKGDNISATHPIKVRAKADSLQFSPRTLTTRVGISEDLTVLLNPISANEQVYWESENPDVAIVEPIEPEGDYTAVQKAKVTGVTVGNAYIRAYVLDPNNPGSANQVRCLVEVKQKNLSKDIELSHVVGSDSSEVEYIRNNQVLDLFTTQSITIDAALKAEGGVTADDQVKWDIYPPNTTSIEVVESTSNKLVLRGIIPTTGDDREPVRIVASAAHDDTVNKVFEVNVLKMCDNVTITRFGEKTSIGNRSLNVGSSIDLGAYMTITGNYPEKHDDYIEEFISNKPDIADVEPILNDIGTVIGCTVRANKIGTAKIYVVTASGVSSSIDIKSFVTSSLYFNDNNIVLDQETNTLSRTFKLNQDLSGTFKLNAKVLDDKNAVVSNPDIEWTSSDESVALVYDGTIIPYDVGSTDITMKSGTETQTCTVNITAPMNAAKVDPAIEPISFTPRLESFVPEYVNVRTPKNVLVEGEDYTLEYQKNKTVGTATITITGMGNYVGTTTATYQIVKKDLSDYDVTVQCPERLECTGRALTPEVNVFYDGMQLTSSDYSVSYSNNTKPGTATVKITGKSNYTGTTQRTFEIYCDHKNLLNSTVTKRPTYEEPGQEVGTCAACGEKDVHKIIPVLIHTENPAVYVEFEKDEYGLNPGETMTPELITRTDNPYMAATDAFRYETDNAQVVTVSETGELKGIKPGTATVTVYGENENVYAECKVVVLTKATDIVIDTDTLETRVGVSVDVEAIATPASMNEEIIWTTSNSSIATVTTSDKNSAVAVVTGQAIGQAVITAKTKYSNLSYDIDVNVGARITSDNIAISTMIDDIPVFIEQNNDEASHTMFTNHDRVFTATVTNISGKPSDDTVVWRVIDNPDDAITLPDDDISQDVIADELCVHGASFGEATITAYPQTNPDLKTTFKVKVGKQCDYIEIYDEEGVNLTKKGKAKDINVGDGAQLSALLKTYDPNHPFEHDDEIIAWTSTNTSVAEVDSTGYITAKDNGKTDIIVTTLSGNKEHIALTVFTTSDLYFTQNSVVSNGDDDPTKTIELRKTNDGLTASHKIVAEIRDQYNSVKKNAYCKWSSSNEDIATVDANGLVTGYMAGVTVITAQSGTKTERCVLTVSVPANLLTIEGIEDVDYTPTKSVYEPEPIVKAGDVVLEKGVDYTVEYDKNTSFGTATVKIVGQGYYTNSQTKSFKINKRSFKSAGVTISSIAPQKYTGSKITPALTVKCDGVTLKQDSDYTLSYSNNVNEGTATVTVAPKSGTPYVDSVKVEFEISKNAAGGSIIGDLTNDGAITSEDALIVLRASVGLEELSKKGEKTADVDNDGAITSNDALAVLRYSVGFDDDTGRIGTSL